MNNNNEDTFLIGGKTMQQWEEEMQAPPVASSISYQDAEAMGILSPQTEQQPQGDNQLYNTLDAMGIEHPDADKQYEQLGFWDTTKDVLASLGTEASHILAPKDMELQYESRTRFGENVKYGYRYLAGTASLMAGGGLVAGAKVLANAGKVGKGIQMAGKLLSGKDLFKNASLAQRIGNATLSGSLAGAIADLTLYRPEENEGHLVDAFGDVDNALISYLQTDENDTDLDAKLKNVVEGLVIGMGVGNLVEFGAKPLFKRAIKNFKALKDGKEGAAEAVLKDQIDLERFTNKADLVQKVQDIKNQADMNGQDASQLLIKELHPEDNIEAQEMLKVLNQGDEIFVHSDGTWDISVNKWDDAHKVSPEEYKKQLADRDFVAGGYAGDTAIKHQDAAVRETWTNRGWIGADESLNKANANKITKQYQDKWQIDNKIKVEFVDGLTINGKAVEGNTTSTKYKGKTTKTQQNAIDKKKLQISKLEDMITQLEGGNKEVADPLDNLKEELRIAKNELKELEKAAKGTNKIPDITIQIDSKAANPYATLRAELEHARDIAKGEVPNQAERHFSRYEGLNEGEVASGYVYKKAQGKHEATTGFNGWYNNKEAEAPVGELLNKEVFGEEIEDVQDVIVKHDPTNKLDTQTSLNETPTLGGRTLLENGKIVIYTNTTLPKEQVEEEIYHELQHARQIKKALAGDEEAIKKLEELAKLIEEGDYEKVKAHPYEQEADLSKEFLKGVKAQYEQRQAATVSTDAGTNLPIRGEMGRGEVQPDATGDVGGGSRQAGLPTSTPENVQQPQQLKLDFSQTLETKQSTEEIANGLINGEVKPVTKADLETVVSKVEQLNPEISGFKFEDLAKDADNFVKQLEKVFDEEDVSGMVEAFAKGDIDTLEYAVRKQLAAAHIIDDIQANIKKLGDSASIETKVAAMQTVKHLGDYITEIKSGFGRGLNSQKLVNKTLEDYGASRLSSWTKEGLKVYTQSVIDSINDIISLNFTRGELIQGLIKKGLESEEGREFTQFLINNKDIKEYLTNELEKLARQKKNITEKDLEKVLITAINVPEYAAMYKAGTLASDQKTFLKTIKNWMDGNGGLTSYYVHNLLSGVGSLVKNVTSGVANTLYFPAKKILASYDMFLDAETKTALRNEGWNTYKNMKASWHESWNLMKEAFINGNGKLTDIGEQTLNMNEGQFRGFHEWKVYDLDYYMKNPAKIWETLQNFHSAMTRAMGATDEFMSQLNYRSIVRAKTLAEAESNAIEAGMKNNEQWINEEADRLFKEKFDAHGKPTDVQALNEARTILYQNNLDGTMFNYKTGQKEQMREQTFVMKMASNVQQMANDTAFVKCMFPFVKTGANILQMALDHNGFYALFSNSQRKLLLANTPEGALARSQVAFGFFSLGIGSMMAFNGIVTGSAPSDPKERKALFATGWKPYSFKVGDNYISYQGYEPVHGMLGFAADCANMYSTITNPEDEERLKHFQALVMPTLVNNFLDKAAFRTGLKQLDLIMNPQDTEEWEKSIAQVAKGFLPDVSFVTNTRSIGEHDVLQPKTMYERVFYRYFPEKWTPMDYRRNVFGEKQSITGLLISSMSSQEGTPEEEALEHLAQLGYTPSEIDDVIANTGLRISNFKDPDTGRSAMDAMKEEMSTVTIQGRTLREAIRELVTSEEYLSLPDGVDLDTGARWGSSTDTKINAINSVFLMYKQRAKKNIMRDSEYFTDSEGRTIQEAKEDIQLKRLQHLSNLY